MDEGGNETSVDGAEAWVAGQEANEQARWRGLPEKRRLAAYQRLDALLEHLRDDEPLSASDAAAKAGVALRRFYQIVRAWQATPDLDAIGVGTSSPPRRATTLREQPNREARDTAIKTMREILAEDPGARTEAALRRVREKAGDLPSRNSLLRWWKAEQRAAAAGVLGRRIALDHADIDVVGPDGRRFGVAFVIDRGARLPLGAALHDPRGARAGYGEAAADALRRIGFLPFGDEETVLGIDVWLPGLGPSIEGDLVRSLAGLPVRYAHDPVIGGRAATAATDGRLGSLRLRSGSKTKAAEGDLRTMEPNDVRALIRDAMDDRHRDFAAALADRVSGSETVGGGVASVAGVLGRIAT